MQARFPSQPNIAAHAADMRGPPLTFPQNWCRWPGKNRLRKLLNTGREPRPGWLHAFL